MLLNEAQRIETELGGQRADLESLKQLLPKLESSVAQQNVVIDKDYVLCQMQADKHQETMNMLVKCASKERAIQDCISAIRDNSDELPLAQSLSLVRQLALKQFRNQSKVMRIQAFLTSGRNLSALN